MRERLRGTGLCGGEASPGPPAGPRGSQATQAHDGSRSSTVDMGPSSGWEEPLLCTPRQAGRAATGSPSVPPPSQHRLRLRDTELTSPGGAARGQERGRAWPGVFLPAPTLPHPGARSQEPSGWLSLAGNHNNTFPGWRSDSWTSSILTGPVAFGAELRSPPTTTTEATEPAEREGTCPGDSAEPGLGCTSARGQESSGKHRAEGTAGQEGLEPIRSNAMTLGTEKGSDPGPPGAWEILFSSPVPPKTPSHRQRKPCG